jgi:hypothetical protein
MIRWIGLPLTALFLLGCFGMAPAADDKDKKDSPLVAATRKKLEKMVTVDFKDQPLKDVLKELGDEVEIKFYLGTGVPQHKGITYSAKEKPLKTVLEEMFKPNGFGYIIHRKEKDGDRYEGWVQVVQGDQRGDDASTTKKPSKADESKASSLLTKAKNFSKQKKNEDAIKTLEELMEKYPGTKAATEGKKMLDKLKEE